MNNKETERAKTIFQAMENHGIDFSVCENYGEKGYELENGENAIILANWNEMDKYPNIHKFLENNYALEWDDEWIIDHEADLCYRTVSNSYQWQPSFMINSDTGEVVPVDDINSMDEEEFAEFINIEGYLNNHKKAINLNGFEPKGTCVNENYEHMFVHEPDPEKIMNEAKEQYPADNFYFLVDHVEQFGLNFSLYKL